MSIVLIRGKAMTWVYICKKCEQKLFTGDDRKKPKCKLCGERFSASLDMNICNACSYETKMCMYCGKNIKIGDDFDMMMSKAFHSKPKKRDKKK